MPVDVIFEGALSSTWGMKDVLQAIFDMSDIPSGVLRVSCPEKDIQGRILIAGTRHVVGADCAGCNDAYEALRVLLHVREGNVAFLDLASQTQAETDPELFISIERLLETLPELPGSASELFDEQCLLDKVFGDDTQTAETPAPVSLSKQFSISIAPAIPRVPSFLQTNTPQTPANPPTIPGSASAPRLAPVAQWNIVEPLFLNPQATHTDHLDASTESAANYFQEQRASMLRLKAVSPDLSKKFSWQRLLKNQSPIKWLLAALGLSCALCVIVPKCDEMKLLAGNLIAEAKVY